MRPDDPATPPPELANVYATLTEVNHFADPAIRFTSQYGADGPAITEDGATYDAVYLLTQTNRSPEARRDSVAHLGSYLFHELTTPLGPRLDRGRQVGTPAEATPFRSLGTYLACGSRRWPDACAGRPRRLQTSCSKNGRRWRRADMATPEVEETACARVLSDPDSARSNALTARIEEESRVHCLKGLPPRRLTRLLASLEDQAQQTVAHDDPGNWARQALNRVREWSGAGLMAGPVREAGRLGARAS